jgi:hypothetical protein
MRPVVSSVLQMIGLECACCRQMYNPNKAFHDKIEAGVFGAEPFAACPVCEMNVPDGLRDNAYDQRCRSSAVNMCLEQPEVRLLVAFSLLMNGLPSPRNDQFFDTILKGLNLRYPDKRFPELKKAADNLVNRLGFQITGDAWSKMSPSETEAAL